jgi:DNA-binding transcriptional ArsR family regulator
MGLMTRKRLRPGAPGRRAEAATLALSWIVTDRPGEWMHGPIIQELSDMGYSRSTAGKALRDLKDAGLIVARVQRNRAHRLYATQAGIDCYYATSST